MNSASRYRAPQHDPQAFVTHHGYWVGLVSALAIAVAFGLSLALPPQDVLAGRAALPAAPVPDPYRVIVEALLAPTLEVDGAPLRWVDPRARLRCGPHTALRVNHQPLYSGALVPDSPFRIEWHADGCRARGAQEARLDGWVTLTVYREDWGFSAIVEPSGLRIAAGGYERAVAKRGAASVATCGQCTEALAAVDLGGRVTHP
jgi:hypothetical protein